MAEFEPGNLPFRFLGFGCLLFCLLGVFLCLCSVIYLLLQHGRENKRERNRNTCNFVKTHITGISWSLYLTLLPKWHKVCRKVVFCFLKKYYFGIFLSPSEILTVLKFVHIYAAFQNPPFSFFIFSLL